MSGCKLSVSVAMINRSGKFNAGSFCDLIIRSMWCELRPGGFSMRWISVLDMRSSFMDLK